MDLGFYQDYDKEKHKNLSQYKSQFLKSIIKDDRVYKFIAFDENEQLNCIKLKSLKGDQLWFSYYKYLNDKTEFDVKYDVDEVSRITGISRKNIDCFIATMKEIYDVCSLTYAYNNYMWEAYGNYGKGICLVFRIINYDLLYPVEYVNKEAIDYTDMLINAYISEPKTLYEKGIKMAVLPYVIKNPNNEDMKSYLEKEIRILSDPFEESILNLGRVYPGVKKDYGYKGRSISYAKCGLMIEKIIIGDKCDKIISDKIKGMEKDFEIICNRLSF